MKREIFELKKINNKELWKTNKLQNANKTETAKTASSKIVPSEAFQWVKYETLQY